MKGEAYDQIDMVRMRLDTGLSLEGVSMKQYASDICEGLAQLSREREQLKMLRLVACVTSACGPFDDKRIKTRDDVLGTDLKYGEQWYHINNGNTAGQLIRLLLANKVRRCIDITRDSHERLCVEDDS